MGWFGPRGLASVVFALLAANKLIEAGETAEPLATVVTLTVLASVFAHGLSAQPLANWYARRLEAAEDAHAELAELPEMPSRPRLLGMAAAADE
jgi:NhaP-type Na+/H+ or K+/H+ antiporter